VEAGEQSSFRRVVQSGRLELGSQERGLDDRDPRVVKGVQRRFHYRRVQPDQAVGRLVGQDGGTLDRRQSNLDENIPRSDSASRNEPSILRESKELADDERLRDRLGHLGMATHEGGADESQTALDAGEYFPDRGLVGSGWKQDGGQEPPRPDAHHGHVVGVDDDGETTDLLRGEGDRVRCGDEHAAGDLDGARILPDARSKAHARWWGWELGEQLL
jgi:hypothetical protein